MLGETIAMLRKANNLSQEELGRRVGVDDLAVDAWEKNEAKPAFEHIIPLARELKTSANHLLASDRPDGGGGFMVQIGPREYVSRKRTRGGIPYVHINNEPNGTAKGLVAIGGKAIGVFAFGGIAIGVFSVGGISLGLIALGGLAGGLFVAAGGLATALGLAVGGQAVGGVAIGGNALGLFTAWGGNTHGQWL